MSHGSKQTNLSNVQTCLLSNYTSGATVEIYYDAAEDTLVYQANVPFGSYIAVGYGSSMTKTDMCFWSADGLLSTQEDLYSTGFTTP
jgi:hypothetical protein